MLFVPECALEGENGCSFAWLLDRQQNTNCFMLLVNFSGSIFSSCEYGIGCWCIRYIRLVGVLVQCSVCECLVCACECVCV